MRTFSSSLLVRIAKSLRLLFLLFILLPKPTLAWHVSPPTSTKDWRQLVTILVESFEEEPRQTENTPLYQKWLWKTVEKNWVEQYTYRQYIQTARKMQGTKYAMFVAKENDASIASSSSSSSASAAAAEKQVVGMVELGLTTTNRLSSNEEKQFDTNTTTSFLSNPSIPRPTIGVLCVDKRYQNRGIGKALLQKCESLVAELWNSSMLYVEVEPTNVDALTFFELCGYQRCLCKKLDSGEEEPVVVSVSVRHGRQVEERPHFLMCKVLKTSMMSAVESQ